MKPILFNTEMVRAILEGRKTVTRRLGSWKIKMFDIDKNGLVMATVCKGSEKGLTVRHFEGGTVKQLIEVLSDYKVGDVLYVRETWSECEGRYIYRACTKGLDAIPLVKWKPSIHMPKEAARIFLRVTDVRVERLQDITEEQAKAEGVAHLFDNLSDEEYTDWTKRAGFYPKEKSKWNYLNYLWHGHFGKYGTGNADSDNWEYQYSGYDTAKGSFSSLWESTVKREQRNIYGWNANPYVWVIEFERVEREEVF